jgi:preprotein translocase subunit SecD
MSAGLADLLNSGDFEADPRFVVTASSMEKAQELELYLRSGSLPAETEVQAE